MLQLLVRASFAAMPASVDLDDVGRWEDHADALTEMPDGCWEWVGDASWAWDVGRFGGSKGDAVFAGRTSDGVWGSLLLRPLGEEKWEGRDLPLRVYDVREARFAPLVGKLVGSRVTVAGPDGKPLADAGLEENAEASNTLREALDELTGEAYSSWAEWDDLRGGVVLHRMMPLEDGNDEVAVAIFFPGGGLLPTELDLDFPESFRTGSIPKWTVRDAEVHVRGTIHGDRVFPSSETFTFGFSVLGWKFSGAQTVRYRHAARCSTGEAVLTDRPAPAAQADPAAVAPAPAPAEAVTPPSPTP